MGFEFLDNQTHLAAALVPNMFIPDLTPTILAMTNTNQADVVLKLQHSPLAQYLNQSRITIT